MRSLFFLFLAFLACCTLANAHSPASTASEVGFLGNSFQNAFDSFSAEQVIAERAAWKFAAHQQLTLGPLSHVFSWDDATPLFEYPLLQSNISSGYVVVSGRDPAFRPIIEYALEGVPLSTSVKDSIAFFSRYQRKKVDSYRIYYLSPLDLVAKLELRNNRDNATSSSFVRIPTMEPFLNTNLLSSSGFFRADYPTSKHSPGWNSFSADFPLPTLSKSVLNAQPTKYQQDCRAGTFSVSDSSVLPSNSDDSLVSSDPSPHTYCSPLCIAGCGPVAWAVLSSSIKRLEAAGNIFPMESCWATDWNTWPANSSCQDVDDYIWATHNAVHTTCGGGTYYNDNFPIGAQVFQQHWGGNRQWTRIDNASFDDMVRAINGQSPFMLGAWGKWDASADRRANLSGSPKPGTDGHYVVGYGYDQSQGAVLISLGWGRVYADKYIVVNDFDSRSIFFSTGH